MANDNLIRESYPNIETENNFEDIDEMMPKYIY